MAKLTKHGRAFELIGGLEIPLPPQPDKKAIANHHLSRKKQKFYRTPIPDSFKRLKRDKFGNIEYTREQMEFINREQERILNGYWFYNNGEATYITGYHYAELNYWKIDIGLKEYRDRDRRVHLHWQYCENDPDCYGQIYMKHRRDGATHRANCVNYFRSTSHRNAHSGIQSKSGDDAGKVFKKMVTAWRKLPQFLQPIHEGTTFPKRSLNFFEPAERISKSARHVKESEALESWIDFAPTQSEAYDGQKLLFYHGDEYGKTVEANVWETWNVVKECLTLGNRIVGKSMITTTVAEMERKGGNNFKKIWDDSKVDERDDNGRTISGLYKLFIPAYDGMEGFVDDYGHSDIEGAKQFLTNRRKKLKEKGDYMGLAEYKRLYPFTEDEALRSVKANCEFDKEKLEAQLEWLDNLPKNKKPYVRGDFVWKDGKRDTTVVFVPNKSGNFKVAWRAEDEEAEMNAVSRIGERIDQVPDSDETYARNIYKPLNATKFAIGIDPYDHDVTVTGKGSNASGYVYKKHDVLEEDEAKNDCFIVQYLHRPPLAQIFYEDMIKLCVFYGCQMLYETQKPRIKNYFEDRGYHQFLMINPKVTDKRPVNKQHTTTADYGQAASQNTTQQISEHWQEHVYTSSHKIPFEELLEDLIVFDPADTEKHDATMGSGYALIAAKRRVRPRPKEKKITSLFRSYDNSGAISKLKKVS